jgi:quercetin dioxygenase-like cupin family protein
MTLRAPIGEDAGSSGSRATMKRRAFDELNVTVARPGVERRVFSGEGATIAFTTLEPGHEPSPHSHPHEQIVYMISGRARFVVGGEETTLGPGDMLVVPPGVEHYAQTLGSEPALDLSVFAPRRDEYAAEEARQR